MTDLGLYKDKLPASGLRVFEHAIEESRRRKQNYVSAAHIIHALVGEDAESFSAVRHDIRTRFNLPEEEAYLEKVEKLLGASPKHEGQGVRLAPQTIWLLREAMKIAQANGRKKIEAADILSVFPQHAPLPYVRPD